MIPDTPSSAASGMGELADQLRSTTEEIACTCSVPMELWQKHSTAVLRAADALSAKDRELAEAVEALEQCEAYFDNRADADCQGDPAEFVPNKEMVLLTAVRDALSKMGGRRG